MTSVPRPFEIAVQTVSSPEVVVRLRPSGEFDGSVVPAFDAVTTRIGELAAASVVVDLEDVTLLDSAGIGAIMRLRSLVQDRDAVFTLVAPQPFQQRLFTITGLAHVMQAPDTD